MQTFYQNRMVVLLTFVLFGLSITAKPVGVGMTDPLNDFSLVSELSSNLKIDTVNPGNFAGDSARCVRKNVSDGYLIYEIENSVGFSIEFWKVDENSGEISVYWSTDGIVYTEIPTVTEGPYNHGYRDLEIVKAAENLPAGIKFLKIIITGGNGGWKGQIGSVGFSTSATYHDTPTTFYIDSESGSDLNSGTSPQEPWKTLERVNRERMIPGDSMLLKAGAEFMGSLKITDGGTSEKPIVISKYGGTKLPAINAAGYLAGIRIFNSGNIHVSDMEITADGGTVVEAEARTKRYGIYVSANQSGEYADVQFKNLHIHHIFATENVESDGQNPTSNIGMGINIEMEDRDAVIKKVHIENCEIAMTGHTGIKMFGSGNWPDVSYLDSVSIINNRLENIGGPGMVPGRCSNVVVRGNVVNYSGSSADPRMHNRGSGIWPWTSKNVLIEKNEFKHAWGKYDSCGAHIDFNCSNITIQYNLSYDNAGGFVEILGNNQNCVYRYNVSINDGYRVEGKNSALSNGYTIWINSWTGANNDPVGANNCRIYNNTIYVAPHIKTGINFSGGTQNNRIENNIIYSDGELSYLNQGENNTFNNNIYYGNIPNLPFGNGAIFANPQLVNPGDTSPSSYRLKVNSPAINTGHLVNEEVIMDFWGDSLSYYLPVDRGADETAFDKKMVTIESTSEEDGGTIYPSGIVELPENSDIPFRIIPKPGFEVEEIRVDNVWVGSDSVYTFQNLNENHTIHAEFYAPADSVTDPLNDFSIVRSRSSNMKIQDENPGNFEGDAGRATRINTEPGHLIYNFKEIIGFEIEFWGVINDDAKLKIFVSENGTDFSEITPKITQHTNLGFRVKTVFTETEGLPSGINFLKFEISGSDANWKTHIGSVNISWMGDERNTTGTGFIEKKELKLYPNPANSFIYVEEIPAGTEVKIISSDGRITNTTVGQHYLDISKLQPGIYFLMADNFAPKRFVKK